MLLVKKITEILDISMTHTLQADVYRHVMDARWQSLRQYSNGDLLNRFNGDVSTISSNAVRWLPTVIISLYNFVSTFVVIWYYSPVMSLIALAGAPFMLLMSRELIRRQRDFQEQMFESGSDLFSFETESFYNIDTIKSFGVMRQFRKRLQQLQDRYRQLRLSYNKFHIRTNILMSLISLGVEYLAYAYGLFLLWTNRITYGTMVLFLDQRSGLTGAFLSVVGILPSFISGSVSARRLRKLMALPREEHSRDEEDSDLDKAADELAKGGLTVRIRAVSFAYDQKEQPVIVGSDLVASPGEIVALVGPSGEGKTTVLRLLLSMVSPEKGQCIFETTDHRQIPVDADSRRYLSYVPQGNTLISGTVAENLRIVKEDASEALMQEALRMACAWDFVEKLPGQLDSQVTERGGGLSEGQAQRVAIARALLRDAPVLLMDEATSALDVQTERKVLRNILKKRPDKTVIITTHRPSVLPMCDRVYRVVDRTITELNHEDVEKLMKDF